eukprot:CAMPEP_0170630698 /NCGR_PEP_ID=MMETSP0224-20130122/34165_1 /TAXON_ID=285029 /ORGANISM="Togula jolla, Strain CCCM 725" /LENGTH=305 /DNA_ID=CAMNT_0010958825 /DNA_START=80 /DNA_END=994 /DNA_ORIENTATION=+
MGQPSILDFLSQQGGFGLLVLLAIQFGAQPLLAKCFIEPGTPTTSLVLGSELTKIAGCLCMLHVQGELRSAFADWTLRGALVAAGLPSLTYLVQNICTQLAYQHLDALAFNVLNQSKMVSTAFFSLVISGRRQSRMQCVALGMVMLGGSLVSISASGADATAEERTSSSFGLLCIMLASVLSGFGSGITEWVLHGKSRNCYLFSIEMAVFGVLVLLGSLLLNLTGDSGKLREEGLFSKWGALTIVPVVTQGWGGIIVGLITKVAGGVKKGFAVISGLVLTCLLKWFILGEVLSPLALAGVPLVAA